VSTASLFLNLFHSKEALSFAAGQCIFKAGDRGDAMYVVTEGEVEIREGSTLLERAGPGSIFGEMALIDDAPRSATVVAKTASRLVAVDRRQFEFMVTETPYFALAVMKVLADRLRKTSGRIGAHENS
jgi:CRP/FNR family transcriptional regulator, cyclic AMP receptor protein